ncbi:hypothetical protein [Shouchella miscanthi]|uniref:hypothetical protein n=1 Tax=Shouchella miscanthi TaxID=2598861 RepID=UPI0011A0C03A|nr:hypothetical protein [Shouchella miscanthi]
MGLLKTTITDSGIEVWNAYYRIDSLVVRSDQCEYFLHGYVSRSYFNQGKSPILTERRTMTVDLHDDALNFTRQIYANLKSDGEFIEARDVLEDGQLPLNN